MDMLDSTIPQHAHMPWTSWIQLEHGRRAAWHEVSYAYHISYTLLVIGRITPLARPSVRLFLSRIDSKVQTRKLKARKKTKMCIVDVFQGRRNRCAILGWEGQWSKSPDVKPLKETTRIWRNHGLCRVR